jgi:RNA polymerase sigma-70 factor, ECF subfamily
LFIGNVFYLMGDMRPTPPDPDAELMLKVRDGDEAAFMELFQRHAASMVGFVDRFFHNRAVAEEVVQEVFLKVYRARKRYQPRSKFTTWLYTIATRTSLNELRRGVHRTKSGPLEEGTTGTIGDGSASAEELMAGRQLAEKVSRIVDALPEKQRAAFLLVRFGGRSYTEVSGILGLSQSAVKSVVFRATEAVRIGLEVQGRGDPDEM